MLSRIRARLRPVALAVCSFAVFTGCAANASVGATTSEGVDRQGPTVIGTDNSAESRVVAALYSELLTAAGVEVKTVTSGYASPADTARAVVRGELSLAPAYETTLLRALPGGQRMPGNMKATLSMALPPGIVALPPAAAQRGVVLAVTQAAARKHGLRTLADLGKSHGRLTLGGPASGAMDAPSAAVLKKAYGVTVAPAGPSKTADVLAVRSTDPVITSDGLVALADPKGVIPPEHVFPLIGAPYADRDTRKALARVDSQLTTERLAALAASVDDGKPPAEVARFWLRGRHLLGRL